MATVVMERTGSDSVSPANQAEATPSETPKEQSATRQRIIDCDVHHEPPNVEVLFPYMPRQYVEQSKDFGLMAPSMPYTNMPGGHAREDLWEGIEGEPDPATVPEVCSRKHLDTYGIDVAVLTGAGAPYSMAVHPMVDYAAAYCRAHNDWTLEEWVAKDDRMKASIHIAPADPQQAAASITPSTKPANATDCPCASTSAARAPVSPHRPPQPATPPTIWRCAWPAPR